MPSAAAPPPPGGCPAAQGSGFSASAAPPSLKPVSLHAPAPPGATPLSASPLCASCRGAPEGPLSAWRPGSALRAPGAGSLGGCSAAKSHGSDGAPGSSCDAGAAAAASALGLAGTTSPAWPRQHAVLETLFFTGASIACMSPEQQVLSSAPTSRVLQQCAGKVQQHEKSSEAGQSEQICHSLCR